MTFSSSFYVLLYKCSFSFEGKYVSPKYKIVIDIFQSDTSSTCWCKGAITPVKPEAFYVK